MCVCVCVLMCMFLLGHAQGKGSASMKVCKQITVCRHTQIHTNTLTHSLPHAEVFISLESGDSLCTPRAISFQSNYTYASTQTHSVLFLHKNTHTCTLRNSDLKKALINMTRVLHVELHLCCFGI